MSNRPPTYANLPRCPFNTLRSYRIENIHTKDTTVLFTCELPQGFLGLSKGQYVIKITSTWEIDMMLAAGKCAVAPLIAVTGYYMEGSNDVDGFLMHRFTPLLEYIESLNSEKRVAVVYAVLALIEDLNKYMIHGDLKPENLVIWQSQSQIRILLIDFENSQFIHSSRYDDNQQITLRYCSQKRIRNPLSKEAPLRKADDDYAAAVTGYTIITGERAFNGMSERDMERAIEQGQTPDMERIPDKTLKAKLKGLLKSGNTWS